MSKTACLALLAILALAHPACDEVVCIPHCADRACGPDPVCGTDCGSCPGGAACSAEGMCACPGCEDGPGPDADGGEPDGTTGDDGDAGVPDAGDQTEACPDLTGMYRVDAECLSKPDVDVGITQAACQFGIDLGELPCQGTVDATGDLILTCEGFLEPCTATVEAGALFQVACSEFCTFLFIPHVRIDECSHHLDPDCTGSAEVCGLAGSGGSLVTRCVEPVAGGQSPGTYCEPSQEHACDNRQCVDQFCAGLCSSAEHCAAFDGTSCRGMHIDDGQGHHAWVRVCAPDDPGENPCTHTLECPAGRLCGTRVLQDDVLTVCIQPGPGAARGEPCSDDIDCASRMCLCGDAPCEGSPGGVCAEVCASDDDCLPGEDCGPAYVRDQNGDEHPVSACVDHTHACKSDAACPASKCCYLTSAESDDHLVSSCEWDGGTGGKNPGAPCADDSECCAYRCFSYPGYCMALCAEDDDCPEFHGGDCGSDDACGPGFLCENGRCQRVFECDIFPFHVGTDGEGNQLEDITQLCQPIRRGCQVNADCRAAEACKFFYNKHATGVVTECEVGGPGGGLLGDGCYPGGGSACHSTMCLEPGGIATLAYCTEMCAADADCGDLVTYHCKNVLIDIRPGYAGELSVCAKR